MKWCFVIRFFRCEEGGARVAAESVQVELERLPASLDERLLQLAAHLAHVLERPRRNEVPAVRHLHSASFLCSW